MYHRPCCFVKQQWIRSHGLWIIIILYTWVIADGFMDLCSPFSAKGYCGNCLVLSIFWLLQVAAILRTSLVDSLIHSVHVLIKLTYIIFSETSYNSILILTLWMIRFTILFVDMDKITLFYLFRDCWALKWKKRWNNRVGVSVLFQIRE